MPDNPRDPAVGGVPSPPAKRNRTPKRRPVIGPDGREAVAIRRAGQKVWVDAEEHRAQQDAQKRKPRKVYLTDAEYTEVGRRAERSEMTPGEFMRSSVLGEKLYSVTRVDRSRNDDAAVRELRRISMALTQLAAAVTKDGHYFEAFRLDQINTEVLAAVGRIP